MAKATKKSSPARSSKRASTNGAGAVKGIDTSRRYSKKELEAMTKEEVTLLAYRMTYDRVHGKRKVRD
jgi:hypothetical protein